MKACTLLSNTIAVSSPREEWIQSPAKTGERSIAQVAQPASCSPFGSWLPESSFFLIVNTVLSFLPSGGEVNWGGDLKGNGEVISVACMEVIIMEKELSFFLLYDFPLIIL